ncbi:MAG: ThiF family adenylyltransferase [Muribaculum sp.]|nr:ThiF family adenylyltransferase [Muribaculum sp.]
MAKFSDTCKRPEKAIYEQYWNVVSPYKERFADNRFDIIVLPNGNIGITGKIKVDAGSDSLLDNREPVVIGLPSHDIENCEPYVFPDRLDFPFENFPHINFPHDSLPATLCLTREDFMEWFVEHTFNDYLVLIEKWFDDAAKGNLIKTKQGDFFEPFHLQNPTRYFFRVPFEDSYMEKCAVRNTLYYPLFSEDKESGLILTGEIGRKDFKDCYGLGMLFTRPANEVCEKWFIKYPKTIGEMIRFIVENRFEWDIKGLTQILEDQNISPEILLFQLAFVRPTKVIGKHTRIDYLTFSIKTSDLFANKQNGEVQEVQVIDLLVPDFAKYLSATEESMTNKNILVLGCGTVGSKLIYHLVRSGVCHLTICDNDFISPHNICRHAISKYSFFTKKVKLVEKELRSMYPRVYLPIKSIDEDILKWLPTQDLAQYDLIIDATASAAVMRCVDSHRKDISAPIVQFALSEGGNIGHLYVNRDPETLCSDFYMFLVREAITNDNLSEWIIKEKDYSLDYVRIGEGCHSNTMVLGDDIISAHTASASQAIRKIDSLINNQALFTFMGDSYPGEIYSDRYMLDKMVSIKCSNADDWEVRIPSSLLNDMRNRAGRVLPKETGGYLMGCIEEKYKQIYVLHTYIPKSSYNSKTRLRLSTSGWKSEHDRVSNRTAGTLVYLGDWHSHPTGSLEMSDTDIFTNYTIIVNEIESDLGICIITNTHGTIAHVIYPNAKVIVISN